MFSGTLISHQSLSLITYWSTFVFHYFLTYTKSISITQDKRSCCFSAIWTSSWLVEISPSPTGSPKDLIGEVIQRLSRAYNWHYPYFTGANWGWVRIRVLYMHHSPLPKPNPIKGDERRSSVGYVISSDQNILNSMPKYWVSIIYPQNKVQYLASIFIPQVY